MTSPNVTSRRSMGGQKTSPAPELRTLDRVRAWIRESTSAVERRKIEAAVSAALSSSNDPAGTGEQARMPFYMSTKELAALLNISKRTLARYRSDGGGPEFHRVGRSARYARHKVEEWLAKRNRSSTSDPGEEPPDTSPEAAPEATEDEQ